MTRNRILDRNKGWSYVSVPVDRGGTRYSISETPVAKTAWRDELLKHLLIYESSAPNYEDVSRFVDKILAAEFTSVGSLNLHLLQEISGHLDIDTPIQSVSELNLQLPDSAAPGDWALLIAQEVGAKSYSNAPGGRHLFDTTKYADAGVPLSFYEPEELIYDTRDFDFLPDMSILDTLMWMPMRELRNFINAG